MKSSPLLENNRGISKDNRSSKPDRRVSLDRRDKRNPNYLGEVRRMTVDRRINVRKRRQSN